MDLIQIKYKTYFELISTRFDLNFDFKWVLLGMGRFNRSLKNVLKNREGRFSVF
jgi:hypothetical protein